VAAIDQALAVLARGGVEMGLGRVLPQARGHHVLGFLDGHAVHVVDHLAHLVVRQAVRLTGLGEVVGGEIQTAGDHQHVGGTTGREVRHDRCGCGRVEVTFAHHDPAANSITASPCWLRPVVRT
jgi:hypothetical protein